SDAWQGIQSGLLLSRQIPWALAVLLLQQGVRLLHLLLPVDPLLVLLVRSRLLLLPGLLRALQLLHLGRGNDLLLGPHPAGWRELARTGGRDWPERVLIEINPATSPRVATRGLASFWDGASCLPYNANAHEATAKLVACGEGGADAGDPGRRRLAI